MVNNKYRRINIVSLIFIAAAVILLFGAYHTKILSPYIITGTPYPIAIPMPRPGSSPALHILKAH